MWFILEPLFVAWLNGPAKVKIGLSNVQNGQKVDCMERKNESKALKKTIVDLSVTDLVRANVIGLLAHYQGDLELSNAFADAYENFIKTGKNQSAIWKFTHAMFGYEPKKRKLDELSIAKLAKNLEVDVAVLRTIFEKKRKKGSKEISVDELVWMAKLFKVAPSYLLQPLREHLEEDATLRFVFPKRFSLNVKAREWLLWVHGIRPLNGVSGQSFEENMMALTPEPGMNVSTRREIWPSDEIDRISRALYESPVSAMIHAQSNPVPGHLMSDANPPTPHPLDEIKPATTEAERLHRRTRGVLAYMQHVRQTLRFIEESIERSDARKDIEWGLNRMREDLSQISINIEKMEQD